MTINAVKFTRPHIVMCVTHDKCKSLLVLRLEQHLVLTFVVKSNH